MKIINLDYNIENASFSTSPALKDDIAVAIGNFDGIHKGHRQIISQLKSAANKSKEKLKTAILTFTPHPMTIFKPEISNYRITPEYNKINIIESLEIDYLITVHFSKEFSQVSADSFISEILCKTLSSKIIITGEDFIFGHNRQGNSQLLQKMSQPNNYNYIAVNDINDSNSIRYSSSRVRELIKSGNIEEANNILNSNFTISGKVIEGKQNGRKLGFPTANLALNDYIIPAFGVYQAVTKINDQKYNVAVNIGIRPTFSGTEPLLEAHILNYSGDLYGKKIDIELIKYLREEKKFNNLEELSSQIKLDIEAIENDIN